MKSIAAPIKTLLAAIVVVLAVAAVPAAHAAERLTFTGKHTRDGVVTFNAKKLKGKKVAKVSVRINGKLKKLSRKHARKLQRSGILKLRATKKPAKRKGKAKRPYVLPIAGGDERESAPAGTPVLVVTVAPVSKPAPKPAAPAPRPRPSVACPASEPQYGAGVVPSACWRPYGEHSPFNRRIADNPRVHANSSRWVDNLMQFGGPQSLPTGNADTDEDWAHPTYYSRPGDPVYTVDCVEWDGCKIDGMQIRVPNAARAAGAGDAHMTVVDQESGWEYDFWSVREKPAGGGTLKIGFGGRTRIDGDGLGSGATAAGFGNLAGIIRAQELAAGRINHALFMVFRCDDRQFVYPAAKGAAHCSDSSQGFPLGTRFQLAMSEQEIQALDVAEWKKTILRAMAEYGMYFGDTGGSSWAIQLESGSTYTSFGMKDPVQDIATDAGVSAYEGVQWMNLAGGVDWRKHLRVLEPCTADGTC